jgi:hypothetical protein
MSRQLTWRTLESRSPVLASKRRGSLGAADANAAGAGSNSLKPWVTRLASIISIVIMSYFAVSQITNWPDRLRYPGEEDGAEGTQLSEMVHLRQGRPIYRAPSAGEFDGAVYGPLCYLLGAAVIDPLHPAYLPLRMLSLLATLGIAILASVFVFRLTGSKYGAVLAPILLLASPYIGRYGISARADMVALMLSFAGFVIFYSNRSSRRALAAAAFLMLLSFFYKQQFIGAPGSLLLYFIFTKRFRQAAEFLSFLAAGAMSLIFVFTFVVFPHQQFITHFFFYNRLPFDKSLIVPEILMFVIPLFVPLLGSFDFVDAHRDSLVKWYVVLSGGGYFLLLFSSGSGADSNRCLEAVVVLNSVMAARIATADGPFAQLAWTGFLTLTLTAVMLLSWAFVVPKVQAEDFRADRALQDYLRRNFPPATPALTYYAGDPLRAGLEAPVTNLWHYSALVRKGFFSDHDVVARIDRGGYGVILLDFDLNPSNSATTGDFYTTKSMRDAILANYTEQHSLELPTPEVTRFSTKTLHAWVPRLNLSRGSAR